MKLPPNIRRKLDKCQPIEHLFESRVASFERYVGFLITFHSMAKHASKPWLLPSWDISRSQSNLRVATTACPVSVEEDDYGEDFTLYEGSVDLDMSRHVIEENKKHLNVSTNGGKGSIDPSPYFPTSTVATEEEIEIGEVDYVGRKNKSLGGEGDTSDDIGRGLGGVMKRIQSLGQLNRL